jgi:adenylate kinase family enzyme
MEIVEFSKKAGVLSTMDDRDPISCLANSRRILVLGSSGSGKTTFSNQLADILNLKLIHLDAHFWKPGWLPTPHEEWRNVLSALTEQESWIMDGTYERTLELRIPAADAIVIIETSRWSCLWRVLKRQARDNEGRLDAPSGLKLDGSIIWNRRGMSHYASWIRYIWRYPAVTSPFVNASIRKYGPHKPLIQLGSTREISACLQRVQQSVAQKFGNACSPQ